MKLETAVSRIRQSLAAMNEAYQRKVFDEIAIVGVDQTGVSLVYYNGPRQNEFNREFAEKTALVRHELKSEKTEFGGEFGFTREGEGDVFDAYICLGPNVFLFCNHTKLSMAEITADPRWMAVQQKFLNASQVFAKDPVILDDIG